MMALMKTVSGNTKNDDGEDDDDGDYDGSPKVFI